MTKVGKFLLIFTKTSVCEKSLLLILYINFIQKLFGFQNKNSDYHLRFPRIAYKIRYICVYILENVLYAEKHK